MENNNGDLNEPFLGEGGSPMKSASEISIDIANPSVEGVFKKIGRMGEHLKVGTIGITDCDLYTVTKNANIFYYIRKTGELGLYSL